MLAGCSPSFHPVVVLSSSSSCRLWGTACHTPGYPAPWHKVLLFEPEGPLIPQTLGRYRWQDSEPSLSWCSEELEWTSRGSSHTAWWREPSRRSWPGSTPSHPYPHSIWENGCLWLRCWLSMGPLAQGMHTGGWRSSASGRLHYILAVRHILAVGKGAGCGERHGIGWHCRRLGSSSEQSELCLSSVQIQVCGWWPKVSTSYEGESSSSCISHNYHMRVTLE